MDCERIAFIQTIDNGTVAGAMDRSFKIKGKYINRTENTTTTLNLTEVLKEMAKVREAKRGENAP